MRPENLVLAAMSLMLAICLTAGCLDILGGGDDAKTVVLYGFSIKGEVMDGSIIPSFCEKWESDHGEKIEFRTVYAGSGKVTNQVINGAEAEVMVLSTEYDAEQLYKTGLATTDWRSFPHNGTVSRTPWIIMTREGNPKGISDFSDLAKPGVEIIHADPLTSGGACWSIFSIYGSELRRTALTEGAPNETSAKELLSDIVDNVISWQSSARQALSQFSMGYGDALITYECEALLSISSGSDYEVVYPSSTILSEHKVVIVDKNVGGDERELIEAFVDYLFSEEAQQEFAEYFFRPVIEGMDDEFVVVEDPFTVEYLGGWETAYDDLIEDLYSDIREG